jgi:hypothetical protein
MEHRIMYLRNLSGNPVGCLAIRLNPRTQFVEYQLSVLNPLDRFDRKVARQLALGRLAESPLTLRVPRNPTMYDISVAVMRDMVNSGTAPSRAVKAAKLWLSYNDF